MLMVLLLIKNFIDGYVGQAIGGMPVYTMGPVKLFN